MGYNWFLAIPHYRTTDGFLDALDNLARYFEIRNEYKEMKSAHVTGPFPRYVNLKPDLIWKNNKLIRCANLCEFLYQQKCALAWGRKHKLANQIPDEVVEFLNQNDITVHSLNEEKSYQGYNEKFTRVWLKCFASDNGLSITFLFNDTLVPKDSAYKVYSFNYQFYRAINEQFGIDLQSLTMSYIKNKAEGIAKLKEVAEHRLTLNNISRKLSRFYEENNDERKAS